jgi:hypothetical protein
VYAGFPYLLLALPWYFHIKKRRVEKKRKWLKIPMKIRELTLILVVKKSIKRKWLKKKRLRNLLEILWQGK